MAEPTLEQKKAVARAAAHEDWSDPHYIDVNKDEARIELAEDQEGRPVYWVQAWIRVEEREVLEELARAQEDQDEVAERQAAIRASIAADREDRDELAAQIEGGELDDLVHDHKSLEGSAINNGGPRSQIDYLLDVCGVEMSEIRKVVPNPKG